MRAVIGLLCTLLLPLPAFAADCGKLSTSAGIVGYCIRVSDRAQNPDILYYFHGAVPAITVDPEKDWSQRDLDALPWDAMQLARPTTISVSWGPRWVLKDEKVAITETEIIPALEAKIPAGQGGRRLVLGASMGGLNAFLAWTQLPHLFDAAAFQCPAFTQFSPRASRRKRIDLARSRPGAIENQMNYVDLFRDVFRPLFESKEEWLRFQPPQMMRQVADRKLPPAYLVHDTNDEFGFDGAPEIAAAGQRITYEAIDGTHCAGVASQGLVLFLSDGGRRRAVRPN